MQATMTQELIQFFIKLNEEEKKSVLQLLKTFVSDRNGFDERISIEQYNKEIDEALEAAAAGDFITQEEMEKRAAKW